MRIVPLQLQTFKGVPGSGGCVFNWISIHLAGSHCMLTECCCFLHKPLCLWGSLMSSCMMASHRARKNAEVTVAFYLTLEYCTPLFLHLCYCLLTYRLVQLWERGCTKC